MADEAPGYTGGYGGVTGTDGTVGYGGIPNLDYNPTVTTLLATTVDDVLQAELDILNAVQNRLNQVQEVWSTNYLGCELATLALISNVPKLYIDTPTTAGTASAETSKAYAQAIGTIKTTMSGMCMTDCGIDSRIAVAQTRSESWKVQGALRYEENRIQLENSNRLNDRMRMIAPGRAGVVEAANSMLAAAKMMGEAARQAEASKGDSGYLRGRIMEGVGNLAKTYAKDFAKSGAALQDTLRQELAQDTFRRSEIIEQNAEGMVGPTSMADGGSFDSGEASGYTNTFAGDAAAYSAPAIDYSVGLAVSG